jgi:uroporphyrinogen decarboxylase
MYKTPEVAAEVTLQPVEILGVDAAILFSDILVIPEAMGMELQFIEGKGPLFPEPIRTDNQLDDLRAVEARDDLGFVMEAIRICRKELREKVPLIGFSGAPWTLATYMIEGKGSKNFTEIKKWRYANEGKLHELLDMITTAVIRYARAQIEAGIQAFQLFDSWAGILDPDGFKKFAFRYAQKIFRTLKAAGIPLIYFPKGAGNWLETLITSDADVLGLDWTVDIGAIRQKSECRFALQGNLDPTVLLAPPSVIEVQVESILEQYGEGTGHIFNLGHGILPDVPVDHARRFVESIKEKSQRYHR